MVTNPKILDLAVELRGLIKIHGFIEIGTKSVENTSISFYSVSKAAKTLHDLDEAKIWYVPWEGKTIKLIGPSGSIYRDALDSRSTRAMLKDVYTNAST